MSGARVLVCAAGRRSSTRAIMAVAVEVADRVEQVLGPGLVDVVPLDQVRSLDRYRAVVVGSAVHRGHWLPRARMFVRTNAAALRTKDVWLFADGPAGELDELAGITHARGHVAFGGRPTAGRPGDHRDWPAVEQWAHELGRALDGRHRHSSKGSA